jgi:hypothetical protein
MDDTDLLLLGRYGHDEGEREIGNGKKFKIEF